MLRRYPLALILVLAAALDASAQSTVFVVRHAERADSGTSGGGMMGTDPELSDAGQARAKTLAFMLEGAGIARIIASPYKRTQQTAAPLAKILGIEVATADAREATKIAALARAAKGNVLIVGHSNTVPAILEELGITTPVAIDDGEYDNLFIVTTGEQPRMVRLRFR